MIEKDKKKGEEMNEKEIKKDVDKMQEWKWSRDRKINPLAAQYL